MLSITIGQELGKPTAARTVTAISWLLPLATVIACIIFYRRARR